MFVPSATLAPLSLRPSAATARTTPRGCELQMPYSGTLTPRTQKALTSSLRRLVIQLRYGARLKGIHVSAEAGTLTVTAVASSYAVGKWLESGDLVEAVEAATRQALAAVGR